MTLLLAQVVLVILAIYHLTTGVLALLAPATARRLVRVVYGAQLVDAAPMDYAVSMIGAQAIAIGVLAAVATTDPVRYRAVVVALALLQLLRALVRMVRARLLRDALGVATDRNAVMVAVLLVEVAVLVVFLV
jgi:hypothetical protein